MVSAHSAQVVESSYRAFCGTHRTQDRKYTEGHDAIVHEVKEQRRDPRCDRSAVSDRQTDQHVARVSHARVGHHAVDVALAEGHQITHQHRQCRQQGQ